VHTVILLKTSREILQSFQHEMVKTVSPVVFLHADYESQYRTFPVSQKPAIGNTLLGDIGNIAIDGDFQPTFNTERFIHRDVRQLLKRRGVGVSSPQAKTSLRRVGCHSANTSDNIRDISLQTVSWNLANDKRAGQALGPLPKQIRAVVIAQILNDCGFQVNLSGNKQRKQGLSVRKDQLKIRIALRRQLLALQKEFVQNLYTTANDNFAYHSVGSDNHSLELALQKAIAHNSGIHWTWTNGFAYNSTASNSRSLDLGLQRASVHDSGMYWTSSNDFADNSTVSWNSINLNCAPSHPCSVLNKGTISTLNAWNTSRALSSIPKLNAMGILHNTAFSKSVPLYKVRVSKESRKTAADGLLFCSRRSSGYGTAPIWYQQSMENGPPFNCILAGRKRKKTAMIARELEVKLSLICSIKTNTKRTKGRRRKQSNQRE
jgi:hypothetical protein